MTRAEVLAIVTLAACSSGPASSRSPAPSGPTATSVEPAAPEPAFEPARPTLRLPFQFTPTRYTAQLAVDPAKPTFDGKVSIEGTLAQRSAVIWLHGKHLAVSRATATDGTREVSLAVTPHDDLLELRPAEPLAAGRWTFAFTYRGEIVQDGVEGAFRASYGGDPYIATQFESTSARLVFPCFDEPDRKAAWQLTLDVPKGLVAASNTPGTITTLDSAHDRVAFELTRPLPSYLVAFTVGPYEAIAAGTGRSGAPLRMLTPKGTTKQAAFAAGALQRIVDSLERGFGSLPYSKLDVVLVPNLQGGAMENAGMVTADARSYLFQRPSQQQQYSMVAVLGHEVAHQWFGDSVTAAWWDDIWLNESFATWAEDKVLASFDPSWPSQAIKRRASAFFADELASARTIRQRIETDDDIHNVFDDITYPKGATVLRMLEAQLGFDKFLVAIRRYLAAHADGNATAADLFAELDEVAGKPLGALVTSYFDQPGLPQVEMTLACNGNRATITLAQSRYFPTRAASPADPLWTIPICVAHEGPKRERIDSCTMLSTKTAELALDRCPAWFAPATDLGYYRAKLDERALAAIRDKGWRLLTPAERISIYNDVGAFARTGDQSLALLDSLGAKLRKDDDWAELVVSLGDVWAAGGGKNDGLWPGLSSVLPAKLVPSVRAKVRAIVEPLANKVRFTPKKRETLQAEIVRDAVLSAAAWSRVHTLDAEARRLAPNYRELPVSRRYVLRIAANADAKLAKALRADLATERDTELHQLLLQVLATIEDPQRHRAMMESLIAEPALSRDERGRIWGYGDDQIRAQNEAYLREHLDAVLATMPTSESEDFPDALRLVNVFTRACDPSRRDEIADYVTKNFASIPSGKRPVAQAIERMDQCISQRKLIEPAARAWLGN